MKLVDLLIANKIAIDRSEAKRIIIQCEVNVNGQRTDCWFTDLVKDDVVTITSPKMMRFIRVKGE